MTDITFQGQILRSSFWSSLGQPVRLEAPEFWTDLAKGARDAAGAAYKHGGLGVSIHAAACYLESEFWKHPAHEVWKPKDKRNHEADLPRWREIASTFLNTLQRQRTAE